MRYQHGLCPGKVLFSPNEHRLHRLSIFPLESPVAPTGIGIDDGRFVAVPTTCGTVLLLQSSGTCSAVRAVLYNTAPPVESGVLTQQSSTSPLVTGRRKPLVTGPFTRDQPLRAQCMAGMPPTTQRCLQGMAGMPPTTIWMHHPH